MKFLSANNVIHRDLALRNTLISVSKPLIVKVADFGMSRMLFETGYYKSNDKSIPVKWFLNVCEIDRLGAQLK